MLALNDRLKAANKLLSPEAVPHEGKLGREYPEEPDATRFPFQRDRDRIIHTRAFRRLKGKTQVFIEGVGDHYRTRLTHTMEVAQISRDVARTLALNEDLAECIALAHDLGHPPFGHAGEDALDAWMQRHGSRFEHNEQSLRIVTHLETHSQLYRGLNLNREVLAGLRKYDPANVLSLEAQAVNLSDEIAYTGHDTDDGLQAGLFTPENLATTRLGTRAMEKATAKGTSLRGALIHLLVTDLYASSGINFSGTMREELQELRHFLHAHLYEHPNILAAMEEGKKIVTQLCEEYVRKPPEKVLALQEMTEGSLEEAVKDYVAGMTDQFAVAASSSLTT